jgi:hypothetical protein
LRQHIEAKIANIREDLCTRTSTRGDNFVMTVKKETFTNRIEAGRALVFAAAAIKPFESTKAIGSIGGFPISIERFDERATLLIHGKRSYRANVSDSPTGTIASLEHALDSIEDRLRERETNLTQSRRQIIDLTNQLDQPFEHEENLVEATKRQQEIVTVFAFLDLLLATLLKYVLWNCGVNSNRNESSNGWNRAAIDYEFSSGDGRCLVGSEKSNQLRNFIWRIRPAQRNSAKHLY